ncbi:hypothetical protein [Rhizobium sp. Root1220]|uniref:hypothetical protein n=1 Tax=Rhizobium sp. Root1220 TaxID=1736432 RepID=UPI0006F4A959|nr:hypothetical protein [Rhizobium sp. Root1220]KQV65299.1 hypothetical protein ASC90_15610 [Rhizobium sp. Root1220]
MFSNESDITRVCVVVNAFSRDSGFYRRWETSLLAFRRHVEATRSKPPESDRTIMLCGATALCYAFSISETKQK